MSLAFALSALIASAAQGTRPFSVGAFSSTGMTALATAPC